MKTLLAITGALLASSLTHAQFTKAELQVNGLTCSMCSLATQKQLQTIDYIDSIGTDLDHTTYILYFKPGAGISSDLIKKKVEDAGFSVGSLVLYMPSKNLPVRKNDHFDYNDNAYYLMGEVPATIEGELKLRVVDKGFLTDKEFKTYKKYATQFPTYLTGTTSDGNRAYHLIIQ